MNKTKIKKFSHFFIVEKPNSWVEKIIEPFCRSLIQKTFTIDRKVERGYRFTDGKLFASKITDNIDSITQYRFHINLLDSFIKALNNSYYNNYEIEDIPLYEPRTIDLNVREGWTPRDYQEPIIEYLTANTDYHSKLVGLRTGQGKTYISLEAIARLSKVSIILIKSVYVEKWAKDITEILDINDEDYLIINSAVGLRKLIDYAILNEDLGGTKIVILTINVFNNYINDYEENNGNIEQLGYNCIPQDFFKLLKAGVIIIDEAHQQFHMLYKIKLHLHIPLTISLTATLFSNDKTIEKMYKIVYPPEHRYRLKESENYINAFSMKYHFNNPRYIRYTPYGTNIYNHHVFEQSVLKHQPTLNNYLNLIDYVAKFGYFRDYVKGDKLAIFASSIDMCTKITEYFKSNYKEYDVRRYCEKDPYENIIDADIRVTTIGSGGTAVDIPDLRCVIQTINVDSIQSNIQTLGRLRKLPNRDVKFYYIWCGQIAKHNQYHLKRLETLAMYCKSIDKLSYPSLV